MDWPVNPEPGDRLTVGRGAIAKGIVLEPVVGLFAPVFIEIDRE
jgi:hypothetical protein